MCKAFSCIVKKDGTVYWKAGVDSHDDLISQFKVRDDTTDTEEISHAKVEIIPANRRKYPYLWPELKWKFTVDEHVRPNWLMKRHEDAAWEAFEKWKAEIYQFDYISARKPVHPFKIKATDPTPEDIELLKKWDSVRDSVRDSVGGSVGDSVRDSVRDSVWDSVGGSVWDSVGDSVWDSVGDSVWDSVGDSEWDSVRDSVWDSVRAYYGSMFPNIKQWKYIKHVEGIYPYQPAVDLWLKGFVPSFDGKIWRLHSGKNAKIVFEIKKEDLKGGE